MPSIRRHFPSLDGLRGAAVIAVFLFHYGAGGTSTNPLLHVLGTFVKVGWAGVTLFFLLSGFLITGILWDSKGEKHWWRNFYLRRILRIFPLYYGSLVIILIAALICGQFKTTSHLIWIPALFLQNFPTLDGRTSAIQPLVIFHYWSLAVEEQFYLLWPLLLFLTTTRKQAASLCLSVFGLSLAFRILVFTFVPYPVSYSDLLLSHAGELALGGWLAMMYRSVYWDKLQRPLLFAGLASGVVVLVIACREHSFQPGGPWSATLGLSAMTILLAVTLARSLQAGFLQQMFSAGWLRWTGKISFGIYIFHVLFMNIYTTIAAYLAGTQSRTTFMGVRWLVAAAGSVLLAWLSFNYFEKPFLGFKKRFSAYTVRT
jgi:peptidoglycan/LPS O-acetylase OafA/YrhL